MSHRYKVIHVIGGGEFGGAEEHIIRLLSLFPQHGIAAKVVCFYEAEFSRALREKNIDVEVLQYGRFDARLIFGLAKMFRREQPAIIHTHGVKANFFARLAARKSRHTPLVTTMHSILRYDYTNVLAYTGASWMEKSTRRWNDRYIAVSGAIRDALLAERVPAERISVVHHGIDYAQFAAAEGVLQRELGLPDDAYVIGAVTRLVQIKDIGTIIRAMQHIRAAEPRARLVVVGAGPEEASLRRAAQEAGVADAVHWTGFRRDIPACLHSFDCFVSASLSEGLGLNVLEAQAAGVPVVATGVGGILDIVEGGITGLLVPTQSPATLAEAVLTLMRDPALADRLAQTAAARVRDRFSLESMCAGTVQVYEDARRQAGRHE